MFLLGVTPLGGRCVRAALTIRNPFAGETATGSSPPVANAVPLYFRFTLFYSLSFLQIPWPV